MRDPAEGGASQGGVGRTGKARLLALALSVGLLAGGVALLLAAPLVMRLGLGGRDFARFDMPGIAMYVIGAAGLVGLLSLILALAGRRHRAGIIAVLVMLASGVAAGTLYAESVIRREMPPINDVQTDWTRPVAFTERTLKVREAMGAVRVRDDAIVPEGEGQWSGMSFAAAQSKMYDDLSPLNVRQDVAEATRAAIRAARRLGWEIASQSPEDGVMEAVYHEPWYGLVYDVAARIQPEGSGSRIDLRVTSRTADRDMGESASQLRQIRNEISLDLR